jgi:glutathione-independent formaldehyde dehydrogenase
MAGVKPGDQTVIYGAGPVGCMAAYSAVIKGASKVMVVDRHPDRLRKAEEIGAIPIDDSKVDPVEVVNEVTMGLGADNGCECVGYQENDPQGHEHPNETRNKLVKSVRFTGGIGVVGVKAKPSWIVSHELPLDKAPEGYEHFDNRDDGWTKVVLHPDMAMA